jgi:hypothetical protein
MIAGYGREVYTAILLLIPPILSILALLSGPDIEERRLQKTLNKAKLKNELKKLEK